MSPRRFPPAPSSFPDGHRLKAPLDSSRGPDKVWITGAQRAGDGQALTQLVLSRNTAGFKALLDAVDLANPGGDLSVIADNLSSHKNAPIQEWLVEHPRVHTEPFPTGACQLNLIAGWWRLLRRDAFAGQSLADHAEIEIATQFAPCQLNRRAKPRVWDLPPRPDRPLRRRFVYYL